MTRNVYEREARAKKSRAIADYLDARMETNRAPLKVARWLQSLSASEWRELCVISGQRPGSEETRREVCAIYLARHAIQSVREEAS